jgi:hypothetical protein
MWTASLITVLFSTLHVVQCFTTPPLSRPLRRLPKRSLNVDALMPPEAFNLPVEAFMDPAAQAASSPAISPIADIVTTLVVCGIAFKLAGGGLDGELDGADKDDGKSRTDFGWLQADMRVPLPTLASLRDSCHLIGQHNGHHMYLCASPQPSDGALSNCGLSNDFTKYYGSPIYVCEGGKSEMEK